MAVSTRIQHSTYFDSVALMLVARELSRLPGVEDAAVLMGTPANKSILRASNLLSPEAAGAVPEDLIIVVRAHEGVGQTALARAGQLLVSRPTTQGAAESRPRSIRSAVRSQPAANVAVISVAGRYAADEAWDALHNGLHVLLFSDNVTLEDEIALKRYASEHGLLLMGPGAGTAILNGVALGFANVVPQGPVGIVSAAGTGLQEVSSLLAREGIGLTQGIGVGGRDLSAAVGGTMMLEGIRALQADPRTHALVLISKPPAAPVAAAILEQIAAGQKPCVVCFLGQPSTNEDSTSHVVFAKTLQDAALRAARIADPRLTPMVDILAQEHRLLRRRAAAIRRTLGDRQRYLRGLYSGGTLCYEAQVIWQDLLPDRVHSNAPLRPADRLPDSAHSLKHTAVDLGEEEFTVGRPHPMIDNELRLRRLAKEASDPRVAVIVLDIVLGHGAHPDPASELGPAVEEALSRARRKGRHLSVVVCVTGTDADPQPRSLQVEAMQRHGAIVCESNAAAARLAAWIVAD